MSAAINGLSDPASQAVDRNAFAELSSEEFVKIMVEELSNQDPFEPNDSAALLEQIGSIRGIEAQNKLETSLESLVLQSSVSQAGGLIGKSVQGLNTNNDVVSGVVTSLTIENGKPVLKLDSGASLGFERLTDVGNLTDADTLIVQQLLNNLAILDSSNLTGKLVAGVDGSGNAIEGVVTSVQLEEDGSITLELDTGQSMPISGVRTFSNTTA